MSRRFLLALAALTFAGAAPSIASAQASQASDNSSSGANVYRTVNASPIDAYVPSDCSGEMVHVTADVINETRQVQAADGSAMIVLRTTYRHAKATGVTTGLKYEFGGVIEQTMRDGATGSSQSYLVKEKLVSQSSAPNMFVYWLMTYSYDGANYTFNDSGWQIKCQ